MKNEKMMETAEETAAEETAAEKAYYVLLMGARMVNVQEFNKIVESADMATAGEMVAWAAENSEGFLYDSCVFRVCRMGQAYFDDLTYDCKDNVFYRTEVHFNVDKPMDSFRQIEMTADEAAEYIAKRLEKAGKGGNA